MGLISSFVQQQLERSVDAARFLKRGTSLLDVTVLIKLHHGSTVLNGVRITPELVLALRGNLNVANTSATVSDATASVAWASAADALLLRVPSYEGSLPDLSLGLYLGGATLLWTNVDGESRMAFGRAYGEAKHDIRTTRDSIGAPVFDDAWRVIGLHKSRDEENVGAFVPIAQLVRELEQSPCWDEIAAVHRLARTVATAKTEGRIVAEPDLARAVRWAGDDATPMSERERRRALAGKTLADFKRARGIDRATTPEQGAIDRILQGPPYAMSTIADDILLPFATAARWFRDFVPGIPDDQALESEIGRRRQVAALVAIVGPRFAPRERESERLREWVANTDRRPLVLRGPGGIGKSALLAHFILENAKNFRFAWIDFDRPDVSADEPSITRVVNQQLAWQSESGPLLVVLDSFETAVQTYGYNNLNPALNALASRYEDLAVIVSSRTPVPLLKVQGEAAEEWPLDGLPLPVVIEWLQNEGISAKLSGEVATVTNGVPLNMKLARDLLKGKSQKQAREIVRELPKELVGGYLYRRILRRLRDDSLKKLAQWTMVPRRLLPELLALILDVPMEKALEYFAALRSELTLLEGDTVLTLRADLRNTLLPLLESEDAARVRQIDRIAADFWAERATEDSAAAEAVYHSLRIGDTTRARRLWRDGVSRYLGGYTMEELPDVSQSWLEARISSVSADEAAEGLVAKGDYQQAATRRAAQSQSVSSLSQRKRRRALESLASEANVGSFPADEPTFALEAIVLASARPAFRVTNNTFTIASAPWAHLEPHRTVLESAVAATGRIQLGDGTVLGTATRVGHKVFITTRSIVEQFAAGHGHNVRLIDGRNAVIDMRAEGRTLEDVHPITRVVLTHPFWDIAIIEAEVPDAGVSMALATTAPTKGIDIAVVGHPGNNESEAGLIATVFGNEFEVKRVMPGKYMRQQAELSFGRTVDAGLDDAAPLSRDFGAPVVDVMSGNVLGVRFSWAFLDSAKFVPAWELARDPAIANAGVALSGAPLPAAPWLSAWDSATSARSTLLDAYLALTSNDIARARALLAVVSPGDGASIDHTLLLAACAVRSDRMHAADLLHELVGRTPREAWPTADRDAVIATRLRMALDAEAELEFLQILHEQPMVANLLERRHFRVLAPPGGELPWQPVTDGAHPTLFRGDGKFPREAVATAKRIVDASNRCLSLSAWIEANAKELANFGYLFNRSPADAREIAAAYIAYPYEEVRLITDFLLEKTDLAPHPLLGWSPAIQPLLMMFRDLRGFLPDGVSTATDLEKWLDTNARSGRLGSYLTELLRIDSQVAWQSGLLHLTTTLPMDSLLKRRFSGEVSA